MCKVKFSVVSEGVVNMLLDLILIGIRLLNGCIVCIWFV